MLRAFIYIWRNNTLRGASLGVFANGVSFASVMPYQSMVGINVLSMSPTGYAILAFLSSLFAVLISISIGLATDRSIDRRMMMAAALVVGIMGNALVALMPRVEIFVLSHLLLIPVSVGIYGQFFAMIKLETSEDHLQRATSVTSVIRALFSLAWMIAPIVSSMLIQMRYPLVTVYAFAALACAVGLLGLLSVPKKTTILRPSPTIRSRGISSELRRIDVLIRLLLVGMVISCPRLASMILGLVVVDRALGSQVDVGVLAGVMALIEIPYILASGVGLKYVSLPALICLGSVMYSFFLAGISFAPNLEILYVLSIPGALGAAIIGSLTIGYLQDLTPGRPGAGGSLISVGGFIGALISSAVFAVGANTIGYAGIGLLGAALAILGGVLLMAQHRNMGVQVRAT